MTLSASSSRLHTVSLLTSLLRLHTVSLLTSFFFLLAASAKESRTPADDLRPLSLASLLGLRDSSDGQQHLSAAEDIVTCTRTLLRLLFVFYLTHTYIMRIDVYDHQVTSLLRVAALGR